MNNDNLEERLEDSSESKYTNKTFFNKYLEYYFKPKSFERWKNGRLYEYLGVRTVQKLIVYFRGDAKREQRIIEERVGKPDGYTRGDLSKDNLQKYIRNTQYSEKYHLKRFAQGAIGFPILLAAEYLANSPSLLNNCTIAAFSIYSIFQGSLIMLQRYHRIRTMNILEKRYGV